MKKIKLALAIAGIYIIYIAASLLNEKISNYVYSASTPHTHSLNKKNHYFHHADLLQAAPTLFCCVKGYLVSKLFLR